MEKIVDDFIKSTSLVEMPLSKFQFAYQTGKSTITALQSLVSKVEKSLQAKEIAVVAFLDIEGAFDNASHSSMRSAMEARGLDKCIIEWIISMLKGGRDGRGNIRHCSVATKMVNSDSTSYFATKTYHCVCSLAVHMLIVFQHLQCDRTRDYHLQNREANC